MSEDISRDEILNRARLLLGSGAMRRLDEARVIIFGVGGVGSWCAEALVRSGVGHLTIVDSDCVSVTNINRQMPATTLTVGRVKVDALRQRLLEIMPDADIRTRCEAYTEATADSFDLDSYDYVIDAIDSLRDKALLIRRATRSQARLFSSMGAALKLDPSHIHTAEFWKVRGCPLARALRQLFKRSGQFPARKFTCVYSDELLDNAGEGDAIIEHDPRKARINGSMMHITAIFGLTLASLVINAAAAAK